MPFSFPRTPLAPLRTLGLALVAVTALSAPLHCVFASSNALLFRLPLPDQLTALADDGSGGANGSTLFEIKLPQQALLASLVVTAFAPSGASIPVTPSQVQPGLASGQLPLDETGWWTVVVNVNVEAEGGGAFDARQAEREFEVIALHDPDECEVLNNAECLFPYPSSRFQVPADTASGYQLALPQIGIPKPRGAAIPVSILNAIDGYSPTVQMLMHFPGGFIDLEASNAATLLQPECCGQPAGPPWIDTRTYTDRSRQPDSPTVLIDWDHPQKRILHFVEMDSHPADALDPNEVVLAERQSLILRPGVSLEPGHRYIVAVRGLKFDDGSDVQPEAPFAALRDKRPTSFLEDRRDHYEMIFSKLAEAGVARDDLLLAYDFMTQSDHQLTHQLTAMRDQAMVWVEQQLALPPDPQNPLWNATVEVENDCSQPGTTIWREITGTFKSPLFLEEVPVNNNVPQLMVDANDVPQLNGSMDAPLDVSIPCQVLEDPTGPIYTLILGHGIFGTGRSMVKGIPELAATLLSRFDPPPVFNFISGATDWTGWSSSDLLWVGQKIIGLSFNQLRFFEAFPDRHLQGQTNTMVLSRLMKLGAFNVDPAFQKTVPDGAGGTLQMGVFPTPSVFQGYYGISMGGVQGQLLAAYSQDMTQFAVDVPSINFSLLLQRSTQFAPFEGLLASIGLSDAMQVLLGVGLLHEVWVPADPACCATHITENPLPNTPAKNLLMTEAWLDYQVSNQGTHVGARTMQIPNLYGSLVQGLTDIPDGLPGQSFSSALVMYDTGVLDILNPAHQPHLPPLSNSIVPMPTCDPHSFRPRIPAFTLQLLNFLQPDGYVANFCNGLCDAMDDFEKPSWGDNPCNPVPTP